MHYKRGSEGETEAFAVDTVMRPGQSFVQLLRGMPSYLQQLDMFCSNTL